MEYKVLIKLIVPEIEESYEAFIPVNKTVGEVLILLNQLVNNFSGIYPIKKGMLLYNRHTGNVYGGNKLIRETDIRNGTELVLVS